MSITKWSIWENPADRSRDKPTCCENSHWRKEMKNEDENCNCCKSVTGFGADGIGAILQPNLPLSELLLPILERSGGGERLVVREVSPRQSSHASRVDRNERLWCPASP